jgi:hypothetical protein
VPQASISTTSVCSVRLRPGNILWVFSNSASVTKRITLIDLEVSVAQPQQLHYGNTLSTTSHRPVRFTQVFA